MPGRPCRAPFTGQHNHCGRDGKPPFLRPPVPCGTGRNARAGRGTQGNTNGPHAVFPFSQGHHRELSPTDSGTGKPGRMRNPSACAQTGGGRRNQMERVNGIEPSQPAWKAGALPLSYTRMRIPGERMPSEDPEVKDGRPRGSGSPALDRPARGRRLAAPPGERAVAFRAVRFPRSAPFAQDRARGARGGAAHAKAQDHHLHALRIPHEVKDL